MAMFGWSFSDGNRHDPDNLPISLAGRGDGTLNTGRHLAEDNDMPLRSLYLAMTGWNWSALATTTANAPISRAFFS